MEKQKQLELIFKHTHADYKGKLDGEKSIMIMRDGRTCIVPMSQLTDEEIAKELSYALHKERRRQAAR